MLKQSLDITEYFLVTQEEFDNYQTRDKNQDAMFNM